MHTIDSPFQTHILGRDHWSGVEWSPLESIWTVRGTEKYSKYLISLSCCTVLFFMLIFQLYSKLWRQHSMAMIILVSPGCLCTTQTLAIHTDKSGHTICITDQDKITTKDSLIPCPRSSTSNLDNWHIIKWVLDILFHLLHIYCLWAGPVDQLCSSPVLLNEVELTVIFGIVITDVTPGCDELLQVRLLIHKIKLCE